jgi:hypothetical protein
MACWLSLGGVASPRQIAVSRSIPARIRLLRKKGAAAMSFKIFYVVG